MKALHRTIKIAVCVLIPMLLLLALGLIRAEAANTAYYVDCSAGSNGSGTQASPWNNLNTVNGTTFGQGDQILFKRGTTCTGQLWPKGSGASGSPITIDAYGTGAAPIINGGSNSITVKLYNQQYWKIQNLEITGGTGQAIRVDGDLSVAQPLKYIHLANINAHNPTNGGNLGYRVLVHIGNFCGQSFDDVLVDNVTAHDTPVNSSVGISVEGACDASQPTLRSNNVTVRNSTVYNTNNDGLTVFNSNNVLIENSVVYESGNGALNGVHTPSGLWTYDTTNTTVQLNESYLNDSVGGDGGAFDLDYFNINNTYQYNYGHDNAGYCLNMLGGENYVTVNSILRYNICSNNNTAGTQEKGPAIQLYTFLGGSLDGVQIYNNTIYHNPGAGSWVSPIVVDSWATVTGSRPRFIKNNIFYAANNGTRMVHISPAITLDYNLYWYTGTGSPIWVTVPAPESEVETVYTSFNAYKTGTGFEAHGLYADPLLNSPTYHGIGRPTTQFTLQSGSPAINAGTDVGSMGSRDFFGNAIPQGGAYDIGAHESGGTAPTNTPVAATATKTNTPSGPTNTPTSAAGNFVSNPGFETGAFSPWSSYGIVAVVNSNAHSGTYAAQLGVAADSGTNQTVSGLTPNTAYVFTVWAKTTSGKLLYVGVRNFGGDLSTTTTSASYTQLSISFTTGSSNTSAEIWQWTGNDAGYTYTDDFAINGAATPTRTNTPVPATPTRTNTPVPATPTKTNTPATTPTRTNTPAATNLVLNPGFESGNANWTDWGNSGYVASNAHSGSNSMRVGTGAGGRGQLITTGPGTYNFSAWGKKATGTVGDCSVGFSIYDSSMTKLTGQYGFITQTSYQQVSITNYTMPAGVAYVEPYVWKDVNGYCYVDDFSLIKQ